MELTNAFKYNFQAFMDRKWIVNSFLQNIVLTVKSTRVQATMLYQLQSWQRFSGSEIVLLSASNLFKLSISRKIIFSGKALARFQQYYHCTCVKTSLGKCDKQAELNVCKFPSINMKVKGDQGVRILGK